MDDEGADSLAGTHALAYLVANGTATPDEARQLLASFVRQAATGRITPRMIEHMQHCVAAYLAGHKKILPAEEIGRQSVVVAQTPTLDKAFGVKRVFAGQPPISPETYWDVAADVLAALLAGDSLENACGKIADERKAEGLQVTSDTQVRDAWAKYKRDALPWLRASRWEGGEGWTADQMATLAKIYADVPGIALPGEAMFEGRHALPD